MGDSLRTLKGVGDKTEKLFFKLGIYDTDDLLHYYPRNYDAFEAPVDIADLEEGTVKGRLRCGMFRRLRYFCKRQADHYCIHK